MTLTLPHETANRALNAHLAAMAIWFGVFLSGFVIDEPAPYELYMVALIGVWVIAGMTIPRSVMLPLVLLVVFNIGGVIAMTQMDDWNTAPLYIAVSLFLAFTAVFYASIIATNPNLLRLIFNGWTVAAVLTGLAAIIGYFHLVPGAGIFTRYGRAQGAFQDPNVFAPYLVLPTIYCLHGILTGRARNLAVSVVVLLILLLATLLSFSRAGWGLLVICAVCLAAGLFLGSSSGRFRLRIMLLSIFAFAAAAAFVVVALQFDAIRNIFFERAHLLQDYDASRLGRFERHWLGYIKATHTPLGIGPLEFGRIYGEDPHNIWLKALFAYSWLGFRRLCDADHRHARRRLQDPVPRPAVAALPALRLYRLRRPRRDGQRDRHRPLAAFLPAARHHLGMRGAGSAPRETGGKRENGRSGGIRTHDPLTPSQVRYRAALRSEPWKALYFPRF